MLRVFQRGFHDAPYDFQRWTEYGLRSALERAGFGEIDIRPSAELMLQHIGHPYAQGEPVHDVTFVLYEAEEIESGRIVGVDLSAVDVVKKELDRGVKIVISTDAHSPKYWPESVVRFINSYGQDKVLFGTDYPFTTVNESVAGIRKLNDMLEGTKLPRLKDDVPSTLSDPHGLSAIDSAVERCASSSSFRLLLTFQAALKPSDLLALLVAKSAPPMAMSPLAGLRISV